MNEYLLSLVLSYFRIKKNAYCIDELITLLGLTQAQMDNILNILMDNDFIEYKNYELSITNNGLLHLVLENKMNLELENSECKYRYIDKSKAISLDEPYVPKDFMKKL